MKAYYLLAKNMLNVMEFKTAKKILEEEALPIVKSLVEKFHVRSEGEVQDTTKELPDNRYSFIYRKKYCLYLKKFGFYEKASEVLQIIIADEFDYYKLPTGEESESPNDPAGGFRRLNNFDNIKEGMEEEKHILNPSLLPQLQVRNTYYQLGKVFVQRLKVDEAVSALNLAISITQEAFGTDKHLYIVKCLG